MTSNQVLLDSGWKFVAAISGGGQEVLGDLTKHGGMSAALLDARIPYNPLAFYNMIGGHIDQVVSAEAARAAAMACYFQARSYVPDKPVFGLAATSCLVKPNGERDGRKHRLHIAIQDQSRTISINIVLNASRTREEEEKVTSDCIRESLGWGCHIFADFKSVLSAEDEFDVESTLALPNEIALVHGTINSTSTQPSKAILSSACNPLHEGHLAMAKYYYRKFDNPVDIELCINNADKPPLDYTTIRERLKKTVEFTRSLPYIGQIILTNRPLFFDKVDLFSGSTFLIGADTYDRVIDPKYYSCGSIDAGLNKMFATNSSFMVFPRRGYVTKSTTLTNQLKYKENYSRVTVIVDPYDSSDISSTKLRQEISNANA